MTANISGYTVSGATYCARVAMPRVDSDVKLDFKDVLVRPKRSTLKSRSEVSS